MKSLAPIFVLLSIAIASLHICVLTTASESHSIKLALFYYGWLNTSNVPDLNFDILVFSASTGPEYDAMKPVLQIIKNEKPYVEVFGYLHNGSKPVSLGLSFKELVVSINSSCPNILVNRWILDIEAIVDKVADYYSGLIDGIFLDGLDPALFGTTDPENTCLQSFVHSIKKIVEYIHSKGLKVFVNGVRAFAEIADYYLWEDFVTYYDNQSKSYRIDPNFFNIDIDTSNPYVWTNGLAKYLWLKNKGLLSKTIALSYAPRENLTIALYGYYTALILGLGGWAFADKDIFSYGGPIIPPSTYDLYEAVSQPFIDVQNRVLERMFLLGPVKVVLNTTNPSLMIPIRSKGINIDGLKDKFYEYGNTAENVNGSHSEILLFTMVADPTATYLYVDAHWLEPSPGGLLHIYIDKDGDTSTGYNTLGLGADYIIEVAEGTGYALILKSEGSEWNVTILYAATCSINAKNSNEYVFEVMIPRKFIEYNTTRIAIATLYNWSIDATIGPITIELKPSEIPRYLPSSYIASYSLPDLSMIWPIIKRISISKYRAAFIIDAPKGSWTHNISVTMNNIVKVLKNGTELKRCNSFEELANVDEGWYAEKVLGVTYLHVKVRHSSAVNITVLGRVPSTAIAAVVGGTARPLVEPLIAMIALLMACLAMVMLYRRATS